MTFSNPGNTRRSLALSLTLSLGLLSSIPIRADVFTWSQSPPGGLAAAKVPMIVTFGFDDNARVEGLAWFADLVRNRRNPDRPGCDPVVEGPGQRRP